MKKLFKKYSDHKTFIEKVMIITDIVFVKSLIWVTLVAIIWQIMYIILNVLFALYVQPALQSALIGA